MDLIEIPSAPSSGIRKVRRNVYGFVSRPNEASVLETFPMHMNEYQVYEPQNSLFLQPEEEATIPEDFFDNQEDVGEEPLVLDSTQFEVTEETASPSEDDRHSGKVQEEEEEISSRRRSRRVLDRTSKQEEILERRNKICSETDRLFHQFTPDERNSITVRNVVELLEESISDSLSKYEKKLVRQRLTELNTSTVLLNQQTSTTAENNDTLPEEPDDADIEPVFDKDDSDFEDRKYSKRKNTSSRLDKNTAKNGNTIDMKTPRSSEKRINKKFNPKDFALNPDQPTDVESESKPSSKSKRVPAHLKIHLDMKQKREAKVREEEMALKNQEKEKINEQDRIRAQLIARKFETDNEELRIQRTEERLSLLEKLAKRRWQVLQPSSIDVDCSLDVPLSLLPVEGLSSSDASEPTSIPTHNEVSKLMAHPSSTDDEESEEPSVSASLSIPPKQISPTSILDFFGMNKPIKIQKPSDDRFKVKTNISRSALTNMLRKKQFQAGNQWLARELGHDNQEDHIRKCMNAMKEKRSQILKIEEARRKTTDERRRMMLQLLKEQESEQAEEVQAQVERTLLSDGNVLKIVEDENIDDDEMALARKFEREEEINAEIDQDNYESDQDERGSVGEIDEEFDPQSALQHFKHYSNYPDEKDDDKASQNTIGEEDEHLRPDNTQKAAVPDSDMLVTDYTQGDVQPVLDDFVTNITQAPSISNVDSKHESIQMEEEREFDDEMVEASTESKSTTKKNAAWKAMILKEAELARKQKKMRAVRDGLVEAEAEEEEEEEDIAGLEDFGFTIGAKKKVDDDEEEDADDIDDEDFDNVVDDVSDNEGDEEAGEKARRALDAKQEMERLKEIKRRVREGYDGRREGIAGGISTARGVHRFDQLVAADNPEEARRLGLQNDDESDDDTGDDNESKGGDGEIDDEALLLDREIKDRHMKKNNIQESFSGDDDEEETDKYEEDDGEENSDEEEDREQERLAKRFAKRARMNRLQDMYSGDSQFSRSRLLDEDVALQKDLKAMKNAQSKTYRNVSVGSLFSSVVASQSSLKRSFSHCSSTVQSNILCPCDSKHSTVLTGSKASTSNSKLSLALRINSNTERFKTTFLGSVSRSSSTSNSSFKR